MDTLAIPLEGLEFKAVKDGFEFSAYASTFGNVDAGGDVIVKGAFDRTLAERDFRPLLWQHDSRQPIGVELKLRPDDHGLLGTWRLMQSGQGAYAYDCLKSGAVRAMSIGYIPRTVEFRDSDERVRFLTDVDLLENSVVSLPMNEQALVTGVKAKFCSACGVPLDGEGHPDTPKGVELATLDFKSLTFNELVALMGKSADAFGESARKLLASLGEGRALTDTKRQELDALLGHFPGLDAVRTDAQALLQTTPAAAGDPEPSPDTDTAEPTESKGAAATLLRIQLTRRRLRAVGVEV